MNTNRTNCGFGKGIVNGGLQPFDKLCVLRYNTSREYKTSAFTRKMRETKLKQQDPKAWNDEIKGTNLTERVYQQLRQNILSGKYKDGEALTELGVAKELNVSRTPVREALRQLELEELIEIRQNRGAVVKGISIDDIRDIFEIRSMIESMAAARAAVEGTEEDFERLEETLDLTQFYLDRQNYEKLESMDGRFHQQLYDICKSRMLRRILKDLHNYVGRSRGASLKTEGRAQDSILEHRHILEAMRARDVEAARERMLEHVRNTRANIMRIYEEGKL